MAFTNGCCAAKERIDELLSIASFGVRLRKRPDSGETRGVEQLVGRKVGLLDLSARRTERGERAELADGYFSGGVDTFSISDLELSTSFQFSP